jgi:lysophospholipase L1-like esterase
LKSSNAFLLWVTITILLSSCASARQANRTSNSKEDWVGTWATAPQLVEPNNMPPAPGLSNHSLRQIVRVSLGGSKVRLRLSNAYSKDSLLIQAVSIALPTDSCQVVPASLTPLLFKGAKATIIPAGGDAYSDAIDFKLQAGSLLAVTIYYGNTTASLTGHPGSRTTSYLAAGDATGAAVYQPVAKTDHWYSLMNIDVMPTQPATCIAALGNSITDGRGSGTNRQNRWTDILSQRLLENPDTKNIGVLNFGIGGNCVLRGGLGPTALTRFDYNILNQSGVKWLLLLEGINDIGGIRRAEDAPVRAKELIDAYGVMIDKAHARGIKVYGCTMLPFAQSFYDAPYRQEAWKTVNEWIRNSGKFDAVIDFDKTMESSEPGVILSDMHDGDHLHPNQAGYKRMGESIDLRLFQK